MSLLQRLKGLFRSVPEPEIKQDYFAVEIVKSPCEFAPGLCYEVHFQDETITSGYGQLLILPMISDRQEYEEYEGLGLNRGDIVASISTFYPNRQRYRTERKGVGKLLLDQMIQDSLESNAKLIDGYTREESMVDFLLKNGFLRTESNPNRYYQLFVP
jgi:hypothetical protein